VGKLASNAHLVRVRRAAVENTNAEAAGFAQGDGGMVFPHDAIHVDFLLRAA